METIMRCGDSKEVLKEFNDNSIDMLCCDPPFGYSFMGKSWDKVLPDTKIWGECFRTLKEGSFIAVMAAPRTDVLWRICRDLENAGFDMSFSNVEWVYHSGFPKATDIKKSLEKRGEDGEKYDGSKAGFQPKPAREIIIIGMKPFQEKSYVDKVLNFEALPDNVKMTYPLIQTPKPSKKEKSLGTTNNIHPTIKPIKLMSYLITLFSRPGDWILDPFGGSGTVGLACKLLDRNHIYIDFTQEYYDIAEERLQVSKQDLKKLLKEKISNGQQELF
jgi:site-specific DNA-methyltransferase (adenine-specific)